MPEDRSTDFGYEVEVRTHVADAGYRGSFRIYVTGGAAMTLIYADSGATSRACSTEDDARREAAIRAELWMSGGSPAKQ